MSDLHVVYDLDDPHDARTYVATFAPRLLGKKASYVQTNVRRIYFTTMSDEEACWVARQLWNMEQQATTSAKDEANDNLGQRDGR